MNPTVAGVPSQSGPAWSYSRLKNYETCPKRHYHYDIKKDIKEPQSKQLLDGYALHLAFEHRLTRGEPLPMGLRQHEPMLDKIRAAPGVLHGEQKLALTGAFQPSAFFGPQVWFRTVIDAVLIQADRGRALIFDWKDGRVKEDDTQLALMAMTTFATLPEVDRVRASLVFTSYGQTVTSEFTRDGQAEVWNDVLPRVNAMQRAAREQDYPAKPSGLCKKYCSVASCPFYRRGA